MKTFNISKLGTVIVERGNLSCNFSVTSHFFTRKYQNYLVKFPKSITEAIKSAITNKNTKTPYKDIYYRTLTDFFNKIQIRDEKEKAIQETSPFDPKERGDKNRVIRETLSALSKNTKVQSFMNKRHTGRNYPIESEITNGNISGKKIRAKFFKIIQLIEENQLSEAKLIIVNTLTQLRHLKGMDEIETRLIICRKYIGFMEQLQKITELEQTQQFSLALQETKGNLEDISHLDLTNELYDQMHQDFLQKWNQLETDQRQTKKTILTTLNQITNLLQNQDFTTASHLFTEIVQLAEAWNLAEISKKISNMHTQMHNEQVIASKLVEYANLHITRVHISELTLQTSFNEKQVEKIVIGMIENGHLQAHYDATTKGIELNYLQQEIDELMKNFQEWEGSPDTKKL